MALARFCDSTSRHLLASPKPASRTEKRPPSSLRLAASGVVSPVGLQQANRLAPVRRRQGSGDWRVAGGRGDGPVTDRWWEKNALPNMGDIKSTQEFVEALSNAGEKLVVVEFYATWCGSCRALFPKLGKLAAEYSEVQFFKVELDANRALCKSLNIKVLPFFHFYRGADGRLDAFPASLSKLQRLKDALAQHSTDRCSLGPPAGPEQVLHPDLVPEAASAQPPVSR